MKITLITVPIRLNAPPGIYIGIASIAAVLEKAGHKINILDINGNRWSNEEVIKRIKELDSDAIGIGSMITSYKYLTWLIPSIKKIHPRTPIVLGGPITSTTSELLFKNTPIDICVIGEGDDTAVELFAALENKHPIEKINGIIYKSSKERISTLPRDRIKDLDRLPHPAYHLFDMDLYIKKGHQCRENQGRKAMAILSGRGCPFGCVYCKRNFGKQTTIRSPKHVIDEMRYLNKKFGIEYVIFVDELFILNKKRVFEFCDEFDKSGLSMTWGCEGRVNTVTKEVLKRMKKSHCVDIGYGIESLSQPILDEMNKGVTVQEAQSAIQLTYDMGLSQVNTLMLGMPSDTKATIMKTVENYKNLDQLPSPFFFVCPYPGTELYSKVKKQVLDKFGSEEKFIEALGDANSFIINITTMTDDELIALKQKADRAILLNYIIKHPKCLIDRITLYFQSYGLRRTIAFLLIHFRHRCLSSRS